MLLVAGQRREIGAGVYVFVARHLTFKYLLHFDLDICFGSRHDAV